MIDYAEDPEWADIEPFPQDDGGPNPLAAIAYTEGYSEAMSYLRAIMAKNELSERALALTEDIIDMNAAHYTVWIYRTRILTALNSDLRKEITWLNETALSHQKNYQIWHHRQFVIDALSDPSGEIAFINTMFEQDSKNYHVWSYRQWLVRRFDLFETVNDTSVKSDDESAKNGNESTERTEIEDMERMIREDVRNNSAWNHRFFLVNGRDDKPGVKDKTIRDREMDFAKEKIRLAPQNQSPWNYLRGSLDRAGLDLSSVKDFCEEFADIKDDGQVRSSHALDLLGEIYSKEKERQKAEKAYDLLAIKYDPMRANYWHYLKGRIDVAA